MDTSLIILGVALIVIIYIVFFYMTMTDSLADRLDLAQAQTPILATALTKPASAKYSYELWLYVYGTKENAGNSYLFSRGANPLETGVKINASSATMTFTYTATAAASGSASTQKPIVITDNLPLQSWVHVIVSVDNSYIDVYMNGKLVKSVKDTTIDTPSDSLPINYGISKTYLAKFVRSVTPTDPQTAWNNYLAGNGENPIKKYTGDYNLALSFKKGDKDSDAYKWDIMGGK